MIVVESVGSDRVGNTTMKLRCSEADREFVNRLVELISVNGDDRNGLEAKRHRAAAAADVRNYGTLWVTPDMSPKQAAETALRRAADWLEGKP
jgi:hypothetical protein